MQPQSSHMCIYMYVPMQTQTVYGKSLRLDFCSGRHMMAIYVHRIVVKSTTYPREIIVVPNFPQAPIQ